MCFRQDSTWRSAAPELNCQPECGRFDICPGPVRNVRPAQVFTIPPAKKTPSLLRTSLSSTPKTLEVTPTLKFAGENKRRCLHMRRIRRFLDRVHGIGSPKSHSRYMLKLRHQRKAGGGAFLEGIWWICPVWCNLAGVNQARLKGQFPDIRSGKRYVRAGWPAAYGEASLVGPTLLSPPPSHWNLLVKGF